MPLPNLVPSRSLELPYGYQRFDYYGRCNEYADPLVRLDDCELAQELLLSMPSAGAVVYTHHQVFYDQGLLKQTRSCPNWEGGVVTYATCKHLMRTWNKPWEDLWLCGLCPKKETNNCILFIGKVSKVFPTNYELSRYLLGNNRQAFDCKNSMNNPRGDLYLPKKKLNLSARLDHNNYVEPQNHTRSLEYYSKSSGSTSTRKDGKIPKWWRDIEYATRKGVRPPCFILSPCVLFTKPTAYTAYKPGRASLTVTGEQLCQSIRKSA